MKVIQAAVLLLLTAVPASADEAKAPSYPAPGVDLALTQGKSPRDFFSARAANTADREALDAAKAAYQKAKDKLDAMIESKDSRDALDAQERLMDLSRYNLLLKIEEAGPCATDEVKSIKIKTPDRTEYWYIQDGSYLIEAADAAQRKKKIQRLKQRLLSIPAKKERSSGMIDCVLVDNASGKLLENVHAIEKSPFYAFTSMGAPVLGSVLAYDFYTKGTVEKPADKSTELLIKSQVVPRPKTFSPPESDYTSPSGKSYFTQHEIVAASLGMTYLNSDGYLRIWSATDYGTDMDAARTAMRLAHLNMLVQLEEALENEASK